MSGGTMNDGAGGDGSSGAGRDLLAELAKLPGGQRDAVLARLTLAQKRQLRRRTRPWLLPAQIEPEGNWRVWLIRAGRGWGKTRAGAEWVRAFALARPDARIALVADTIDEARAVMIEGESGLLKVARGGEIAWWRHTLGEIGFANGAVATLYSASRPEVLRGPEHHIAWCDEIAKWRYGEAAWDNLLLGLRLGERPRAVVTTTPRPNALMRRIMTGRGVVETVGRTRDNPHLPPVFVEDMEHQFGGTAKGRQELDGEMIEEAEGALWSRELIERCRADAAPELVRVVVGVDPPASAGGDACGIVAAGLGRDGRGYVLEDASVAGLSPEGWARAVAACAARWGADRVVAERNQGGEMVASVLRAADEALPVKLVHASRGKAARAEPVATLYEAGKAAHAGRFPELEDELCGLRIGGAYEGPGRSPDRADACVWALHALVGGKRGEAGVRVM